MKLFKHYWKWQWGATGKATRLFSHKLRLDQKWINSCKKVYHPKHVLSKSLIPIWRGAPFHFSIDICFALIIIFLNFKVLEVQNTKKTFLGVSWWYVINCSKIRQWTYTSKILVPIPLPLICITLKIPISNDFIVLLLIVNVTSKKETGFFLVFKVRPVLFRVVFMTLPSVYDGDFMPK